MNRLVCIVFLLGICATAEAQRYFEVGVKASRERVSYIDLKRVAALPARTQDLNMGVHVLHHVNRRLAFLGAISYNSNRYFGRYDINTNDPASNVALMEAQSLETLLGVRVKFMSEMKLQPYINTGISQSFLTSTDFPKSYVIHETPFVNDLPELRPRAYNLAVMVEPGVRYKAHDYLTIDFEPIFKWYAIGNTSYRDQMGLGWSVSLNYRIGK